MQTPLAAGCSMLDCPINMQLGDSFITTPSLDTAPWLPYASFPCRALSLQYAADWDEMRIGAVHMTILRLRGATVP